MPEQAPTLEVTTPLNRDIEFFLLNAGSLEIYDVFGWAELHKYLEDIALLRSGVAYTDLGIWKRREAAKPRLLTFNDALSGAQFVNYRAIRDEETTPPGSIALLSLSGVMRAESGLSTSGVNELIGELRNAYANSNVGGVIIETNSGGGESLAGTMLKSAIQERNKPVVGFAHLAASAAYRALSGADEIIASGQGSEFGSIGTMLSMNKKMLDEYREKYADFYGAGAPGKNADFRGALGGDFSLIQKRVDAKTAGFQLEVESSRPLRGSAERIKETLNGQVFEAIESKRRGLVDMIGTMSDAVKRVRSLRKKY